MRNIPISLIDPDGLSPAWALPPQLAGGDQYSRDFQQGWYDQARWAPAALLAIPAALASEALIPAAAIALKTCQGKKGGQLVGDGVRALLKGEKPLSELSRTEIELAKKGYQQAADTAKNATQRAYQEARIRALEGKGPPPGPLSEFTKTYRGQ